MSTQYFETIENNLNKSASLENSVGGCGNLANGDVGSSSSEQQIKDANLAGRIIELQNVLERQSKELAEARVKLGDMQIRLKDSEERHHATEDKLNKDLAGHVDMNKKLQRDLKEALQQKEEQEQRITNLEQRYVSLQREYATVTDAQNRLETELAIRENSLKHVSYYFATALV